MQQLFENTAPAVDYAVISASYQHHPANTRHLIYVGSKLGQCRRRWPSIDLTLIGRDRPTHLYLPFFEMIKYYFY